MYVHESKKRLLGVFFSSRGYFKTRLFRTGRVSIMSPAPLVRTTSRLVWHLSPKNLRPRRIQSPPPSPQKQKHCQETFVCQSNLTKVSGISWIVTRLSVYPAIKINDCRVSEDLSSLAPPSLRESMTILLWTDEAVMGPAQGEESGSRHQTPGC